MKKESGAYYVETWDVNLDDFTPQKGVRTGPYSLWGLRKPLLMLRQMGYTATRNDPSILVERRDAKPRKKNKEAQLEMF